MVIVGVCGFAGSGKDTFADLLVQDFGFKKRALAQPLKHYVKYVFDFTDEQIFGASAKRNEPDLRYPFKGVCPTCHGQCAGPANDAWKCFKCSALYPLFVTPRLALQTLGTEWGRALHDTVWVDLALREMASFVTAEEARWVVSDVRFRNEVDTLKAAGVKLVRLKRGMQQFAHSSEAEMTSLPDDLFDYVIDNRDTTVEWLHTEAARIAREILSA